MLRLKTNVITDTSSNLLTPFTCHTVRDANCSQPSWLCANNVTLGALPTIDITIQNHLRKLSRLARSGGSQTDGHFILVDVIHDLLGLGVNSKSSPRGAHFC